METRKNRLNSDYRELFIRMMVDSKEVDFSIIHRVNRKFIDLGCGLKLCDWAMVATQSKNYFLIVTCV